MASDLTQGISTASTAMLLTDPAGVIAADLQGEDILLETDEPEQGPEHATSYTVRQRLVLTNRVRAMQTELTLFREGYLAVRELGRKKHRPERLLDLRYLDPRPVLSRFIALKVLHVAAGLLAAGALVGTLAYFSILFAFTAPAALSLIIAAAATFSLFVYRTEERVVFRMHKGRAPVLILRANLGCMRAGRALVPHLVRAITEANQGNTADKHVYLRQEMREHYRLRKAGVLTDDACATGTQRILSLFD